MTAENQKRARARLLLQLALIGSVLAMAVVWLIWFVPEIDEDSARWTLSSLVQGMASILGLAFVAEVFIWGEIAKLNEERKTRPLMLAELKLIDQLNRARGWEAGTVLAALVMSIISGLMVLSGYNDDTPKIALIIPVALGVASTLSIALLVISIMASRIDDLKD